MCKQQKKNIYIWTQNKESLGNVHIYLYNVPAVKVGINEA